MTNKEIRAPARMVLVLDDEVDSRECLRAELSARSYEVFDTGDPSAVLKSCEELEFHLLIVSLNLPSLVGTTFLQRIRLRHPDLPIIVMSRFCSMENTATAFRYGANDFIRKPEDPEELRKAVGKIVAVQNVHSPHSEAA